MKKDRKASKDRKITTEGLRKLNLVAALLSAAQGVVILLLADSSRGLQAVTANFLGTDKLSSKGSEAVLVPATRHLFDINIAYIVAAFLFIAAAAHLLVATRYRKKYENDLKESTNQIRWIEYSLCGSVMMIAIALLGGIFDLSALILIATLTVVMSLSGLIMEANTKGIKKPNWATFKIGLLSAFVLWLVFAIYLWAAEMYGSGVPNFVYWIYGTMFVLFGCFVLNMYMQSKKRSKWASYLHAERAYIVLSVVTKAALAWQVFFGALKP